MGQPVYENNKHVTPQGCETMAIPFERHADVHARSLHFGTLHGLNFRFIHFVFFTSTRLEMSLPFSQLTNSGKVNQSAKPKDNKTNEKSC